MGLAVRNRKSSPKSYYSCEWSNGYSFFIGFLYRVIPADGVCLPCAFLTDGRLLRLILLFVLVRIPFEKIKLRPLVVGTDESTEQVPLVVGHALDAGRLTLCQCYLQLSCKIFLFQPCGELWYNQVNCDTEIEVKGYGAKGKERIGNEWLEDGVKWLTGKKE